MTAFNFGSYLKSIKDAFITNKGQEKAGNLLLNSVASQLDEEVYFEKSKISHLSNNKSEVDEIIKNALQRKKIVNALLDYFEDEVFADLKQELVPDICSSLIRLMKSDTSVPNIKTQELEDIYDNGNISEFLAKSFIYAVQRQNKLEKKKGVDDKPQLTNLELASLRINPDGSFTFKNQTKSMYTNIDVPDSATPGEMKYIKALLSAYAEDCGISDTDNLPDKYNQDLKKQRKNYYKAESIRRGVRDNFSPKENNEHFELLKDDMYEGIEEVYEEDYDTGYIRLKEVLKHSSMITLNGSLLASIQGLIGNSAKKGICHMLVNDGKITWVVEDE